MSKISKDKQKPLLPKLRFPEFQDAGDWIKIKLIDTADKKIKWSFIGGPFGSNLKYSDYTNKGIRIIQLQNIGDAEFHNDYQIFTSEDKANELLSNNIYPGDIILSKMGDPVGRACLIPNAHERYVMCSDGIRLAVDNKTYNKYFIYSLINSIQFRSLVKKTATGSTRKRIGLVELKNLPLYVPKPAEQKKIAGCLLSIDDLIEAEGEKLGALKDHKKGLMQNLFPVEGKTLPNFRFPEFQDTGTWKEKKFGKIAEKKSSSLSANSIENNKGDYALYGASGRLKYIDFYQEKNPYVSIVKDGSGVGRVLLCEPFSSVLGTLDIIKPKSKNNLYFIYSLLQKINFLKYIAGGAIPHIYFKDYSKEDILVPRDPEEQQKIADCLSSLDDLISAQDQKIDALKKHKKGLIQQLFFAVEDVA